jgi:hypothetical protein
MTRNDFNKALMRIFKQPAFIAIVAILVVASIGLNGAIGYMQLSFKKLPVYPARPLRDLPSRLGPWQQVSIDESLDHEMQDALATDKYVFRDYVDTRVVKPAELEKFKDKTPRECRQLLLDLQTRNPAAVVNLGLTYYTGLVDTVAHIPDRCYIADGYEPTKYDVVTWPAIENRNGDHKLRFIVFEDSTPGREGSLKRNVAYFFHCNGQYVNDPIGVRKALAQLLEKYGYYMKVEVQMLNVQPDVASRTMNDFLENLLPESEKALPDWAALHRPK